MLRFRLQELMAEKSFKEGKRVSIEDVSNATGIHRSTLSRIINVKGHKTTTDIIDTLCDYFDCEVGDLVVRVKEE